MFHILRSYIQKVLSPNLKLHLDLPFILMAVPSAVLMLILWDVSMVWSKYLLKVLKEIQHLVAPVSIIASIDFPLIFIGILALLDLSTRIRKIFPSLIFFFGLYVLTLFPL